MPMSALYGFSAPIRCSTGTEVGQEFAGPLFQGSVQSGDLGGRGFVKGSQDFLGFAPAVAGVVCSIGGTQIVGCFIGCQDLCMTLISGDVSLQASPLPVAEAFYPGA
jgi:hypothetical protein